MTAFACLALAALAPLSDLTAGSAFARGVELRGDAAAARPWFRLAGELLERDPAAAEARGRAYLLGGDPARAVLAFRDALAADPSNRRLRRLLTQARAEVESPPDPELARSLADAAPLSWRDRLTPAERFALAGLFGVAVLAGLARYLTRRDRWARWPLGVGVIGWLLLAPTAWPAVPTPAAVLLVPSPLYAGNGAAYPARFAYPLPAGSEVEPLATRGGWVQVRLPGGAVGWVPGAGVRGVRDGG